MAREMRESSPPEAICPRAPGGGALPGGDLKFDALLAMAARSVEGGQGNDKAGGLHPEALELPGNRLLQGLRGLIPRLRQARRSVA